MIFYPKFVIILLSMNKVIIPRNLAREDLVVIARSEYERLLSLQTSREEVNEDNVLQWSAEAKAMKKRGALPVLNSLADLR